MDLLNIVPLTGTVNIRGTEVEVKGLEAQCLGSLIFRFPEFRKAVANGAFDISAILALSDDIVAAICAGGVERLSEEGARNLSLAEKAEILGVMAPLTMPRGVVPFVEAVAAIINASNGAPSPKAPSTKSRKPSNT